MGAEMKHTVDAVSIFAGTHIVVIKRLTFPCGLALPGGKIEPGENLNQAIIREVKEETGLDFKIEGFLSKIYDDPKRDPRFHAVSRVAYGSVFGEVSHEKNKTEVIMIPLNEVLLWKDRFVFDHAKILSDYLDMMKRAQ
jgi:ADP-ribose pyrophosphatase YjhB (NUDIX family)